MMLNRLRRWLYRRIEGVPQSPLSVQVSDPWTLCKVEELRGRIARQPFDHDAVQLAADFSGPEATWPIKRVYSTEAALRELGVESQRLPGNDCPCGGRGGKGCPEMVMTRIAGDTCCGGGANLGGHEWNCRILKAAGL